MKQMAKIVVALSVFSLALAGPADAHVRTANTRLSLSASDTKVHAGDQVTLTAHLRSAWKACVRFKKINLYRYGTKVAQKKTNNKGIARYTFTAQHTAQWQVKFKGRKWGKHPHSHRCLASHSKTITVKVTA